MFFAIFYDIQNFTAHLTHVPYGAAESFNDIVACLHNAGYDFVTVDDLVCTDGGYMAYRNSVQYKNQNIAQIKLWYLQSNAVVESNTGEEALEYIITGGCVQLWVKESDSVWRGGSYFDSKKNQMLKIPAKKEYGLVIKAQEYCCMHQILKP